MEMWQEILGRLEPTVSAESYANWLQPLRFSHVDQQRALHLVAPNESAKKWLDTEYKTRILSTAGSLALDIDSVVFLTETAPGERPQTPRGTNVQQAAFDFDRPPRLFNSKYTFDSFVVGSCNEFAHAAAQAVAGNPARAYNPLYIYGGTGMGKTHLMHAIGQQLQSNYSALQVVYVSSEEFINEMINSLRYDGMSSFHQRFRATDVLLVDDIQILGSKERTQEEFFHTFNALHNMQKQIVISSDRPPKEVNGLVDRLRSRFEWGLLADIQAPDLETKMAILDRKAEDYSIKLPHKVRIFLATHLKSNVRELEGALTRLMAIASLSGSEITLQMAQQTVRALASGADRPQQRSITIPMVQKAVCNEFSIDPKELRQKTGRSGAFPRQVAMYLCKELVGASLPEIGRAFGGKHHTTVLHAVQKLSQLRNQDQDINSLIHKLTDRIN